LTADVVLALRNLQTLTSFEFWSGTPKGLLTIDGETLLEVLQGFPMLEVVTLRKIKIVGATTTTEDEGRTTLIANASPGPQENRGVRRWEILRLFEVVIDVGTMWGLLEGTEGTLREFTCVETVARTSEGGREDGRKRKAMLEDALSRHTRLNLLNIDVVGQ